MITHIPDQASWLPAHHPSQLSASQQQPRCGELLFCVTDDKLLAFNGAVS